MIYYLNNKLNCGKQYFLVLEAGETTDGEPRYIVVTQPGSISDSSDNPVPIETGKIGVWDKSDMKKAIPFFGRRKIVKSEQAVLLAKRMRKK